jgi:hypothetical protein
MIGIITSCLHGSLKVVLDGKYINPCISHPTYKSICHMASFINYVFSSNFELLLLGVENVD